MEKTFKERVLKSVNEYSIKLSQEAKLLIHGIKPAWLTTKRRPDANFLSSWYPNIGFPHRNDTILIFNNGITMHEFLKEGIISFESTKVKEHSLLDYKHEVIGYYLGYPPMAVEWFAKHRLVERDKITHECAVVYYHGLQFVTGHGIVEDTIDWLLQNKPIPNELKTYATYRILDRNSNVVKKVLIESKYVPV
jgi:hypothetical protein